MSGRLVYGLMGFRYDGNKVWAAVCPSRHGLLNGAEAEELPCPRGIAEGSGEAQERWARAQLAKQGKAFHGVHVSDIRPT